MQQYLIHIICLAVMVFELTEASSVVKGELHFLVYLSFAAIAFLNSIMNLSRWKPLHQLVVYTVYLATLLIAKSQDEEYVTTWVLEQNVRFGLHVGAWAINTCVPLVIFVTDMDWTQFSSDGYWV